MNCIDSGHLYVLNTLDDAVQPCVLRFVKREGPNYPGNIGHWGGTTSQEVLRALIYRAGYVNDQIPCWQTGLSHFLMSLVVWLYEHRAAKRHHRSAPGLHAAVCGPTCKLCGHVGCEGVCRELAAAGGKK